MVWFESSDVYGHGAATRHPRAGLVITRVSIPLCHTSSIWTLPLAPPPALHPPEQGQHQQPCSEVVSIRFPCRSWNILPPVGAAKGWRWALFPFIPRQLSLPSALSLSMQPHKRHSTKSPPLPHLHKSGAASTAQGISWALASQHSWGTQDTALLLGSNPQTQGEESSQSHPRATQHRQACSHLHKPSPCWEEPCPRGASLCCRYWCSC